MAIVNNPKYIAAMAALKAAQDKVKAEVRAEQQPPQQASQLATILAKQQREAEAAKAPLIAVPSANDFANSLAAAVKGVNWNVRQNEAITMATRGQSFCLIGAAGTGKTTTLKGCVAALEINYLLPPIKSGTKWLTTGDPGIVFVSYTRRAVRQISRNLPPSFAKLALTAHKVLEYQPVFYEMVRPDGSLGKTMRFEPTRTRNNPLPAEIRTCVIDEASMMSEDLFQELVEALPRNVQFILLGDIHQLFPVYGDSVLAKKLTEFPVVELVDVYRQALDSPIISLATTIKDGRDVPLTAKTRSSSPDGKSNVVINPWPKQLSAEDAMDGLAGTIKAVIKAGDFNEEEDVILMPFNKSCGTVELNLHIANTLAIRRGAVVHHVIAGFMHHYLAVGDRLLVDKQDCIVRGIERNLKYVGKLPLEPATTLDRWGTYQDEKEHHHVEDSDEDIDDMLERMSELNVEDKVNEASHVLVLESLDSGAEFRVSQVGTYNSMVFSYALTVHKSQGSEWRRVFLFLQHSHHTMCSRELLYTAVTRAREDLIIICEPDRRNNPGTLTKAARGPRIKGNTLAEKLEWLKQRASERNINGNEGEL